ncbi:hypothetical protein H2200_002697 [Cladophialophora chaetospira]|uniref:Uncharacterized protein n=1 Tax=Cladophialophora chaetospira TaxID=386627 RepID=A0AA38XJC7_9EURO|nr:hypothetical protein H2200_002697 [Cladophialophora chaetospira]
MSRDDDCDMDMPSKPVIRVVVPATQEIDIPIEEEAFLSTDIYREMIRKELPKCRLRLKSLRLPCSPESKGSCEDYDEVVTDEMKDTVVFRMVTDAGPPAANSAPVMAVTTDKSFIQIDVGDPVSNSSPASEHPTTSTEHAPIEIRKSPRPRKKNHIPTFEPNTAGNKVQKRQAKAERKKQLRTDRGVKAHPPKQDKPDRRTAKYFEYPEFDEFAKKRGLANAVNKFARKRDARMKKRLRKAAKKRWAGEAKGLTEDKKLDMIADQLANAFDSSKKKR